MKSCDTHRHEHRDLPCPWPDCPNGEGATNTMEIMRHAGAGKMTRAEGHFDAAPPPRVFQREPWDCDKCGAAGWSWVEAGAEPRMDRCPHRRPKTVWPRGNTRAAK
ncbi:MAG TPA: hypothetical protein VFV49_04645 [Thermoanaerobaculia bacterium]|nr:hypothetical protein [Thermoanaerobaculia bacterium]